MTRSRQLAAFALLAACARPQAEPPGPPSGSTALATVSSAPAPQPEALASTRPSAASCAEADVNLDLRAWPTNVRIDVERESVYQASKFRDAVPKGETVRVYPKSSYGFVARFDAASEHEALTQCAAAVDAYLPGAPTRHPLDHTPVVVTCHPCGKAPPAGAALP